MLSQQSTLSPFQSFDVLLKWTMSIGAAQLYTIIIRIHSRTYIMTCAVTGLGGAAAPKWFSRFFFFRFFHQPDCVFALTFQVRFWRQTLDRCCNWLTIFNNDIVISESRRDDEIKQDDRPHRTARVTNFLSKFAVHIIRTAVARFESQCGCVLVINYNTE